jgi:isopentenyl diphosphate isomerase/L-lactate dehydrogenase-like FMN-dependent dehydrogenase
MADSTMPASHQWGIYAAGMFQGQLPTVTTDPNALEEQARAHMSSRAFAYVAGGAGAQRTVDANQRALREWRLVPRMMRSDAGPPRDLGVTLFGVRYPAPVVLAPVGVLRLFHADGEEGVARVAAELGVPFVMSSAATCTIEDVAKASGDGAPRWFQLYWPRTDEITASLLRRAKAGGFSVLVVTLDTPTLAWRPLDLDLGHLPFVKGMGNQIGLSDPVFRRIFKEKTGKEVEDDIVAASVAWQSDAFSGRSHPWEKLKFLREHWDGPIVLKGIQHVDDARMAADAGMDGIIVSNHGGRQLDGAIGSLTVLPEIVDAVGSRLTVLFDSGIRSGTDIMKALSLGAKAVLLARPYVYGLGVNGAAGAKDVIKGILADLDQSMGLAGVKSISALDRSGLRRVVYQGE